MFRQLGRGSTVIILVILGLVWSVAGASATARASVIVVLDDAVASPAALAKQLGRAHDFTARHVYGTALKGFVAAVPTRAVAALAAHPRVAYVEAETVEQIVAQTTPTGVDRIEVDKNTKAGVGGAAGPDINLDVAVIDTGIRPDHPDLRVAGGYAAAGSTWSDGNGHGTHVAGTVAARDNDFGVVGVAPGARVWAVRVCGNSGFCMSGDIVAGIDWVAQQKTSGAVNFAAANFSISSADTTSSCNANNVGVNATHSAICRLVATGVVFVMAAGNDARLKNAYPEAFTVAAITDFNGKAGGGAASTCRSDVDDRLASYSNWGVDIAAPGTCILSTWRDGGYNTISGTSMATPHVTGAVALYLHANNLAPRTNKSGVNSVKTAIINAALPQSHECGYVNHRGTSEKLLFVNGSAFGGNGSCDAAGSSPPPPNTAPTVSITAPANGATFVEGASITFTGSASDTQDGNLTSGLAWTSSINGAIGSGGSFSRSDLSVGTHTITASVTDSGGLTGSASISLTVNAPSSASAMHLGGLSGEGATVNKARWSATVTATVHDASHTAVSGATVTGTWSGGASGSASCTTNGSGTCSVSTTAHRNSDNVTFTVTDIAHSSHTYDAAANDVPTFVIVAQP